LLLRYRLGQNNEVITIPRVVDHVHHVNTWFVLPVVLHQDHIIRGLGILLKRAGGTHVHFDPHALECRAPFKICGIQQPAGCCACASSVLDIFYASCCQRTATHLHASCVLGPHFMQSVPCLLESILVCEKPGVCT